MYSILILQQYSLGESIKYIYCSVYSNSEYFNFKAKNFMMYLFFLYWSTIVLHPCYCFNSIEFPYSGMVTIVLPLPKHLQSSIIVNCALSPPPFPPFHFPTQDTSHLWSALKSFSLVYVPFWPLIWFLYFHMYLSFSSWFIFAQHNSLLTPSTLLPKS